MFMVQKQRKILSGIALISLGLMVGMPNAQAYSGEQFVVCKLNPNGDNFLALRTCGSSNCRMIAKLRSGTFVTSLEPTAVRRWREIVVQRGIQDQSYKGPSGWVYDKFICEVRY